MPRKSKKQEIQGIKIEKWVCCIDCGLLIEPVVVGKSRWTICEACSKVYTQTTHPWLSRMLAHHLASPPEFLRKKNIFKKARFFMCQKCGNYYIDIEGRLHNGKTICKWCISINHTNLTTIADRCVVCSGLIYHSQNNRKMTCRSCAPVLKNIKKVLKYICMIMRQAKQKNVKIEELAWAMEDV